MNSVPVSIIRPLLTMEKIVKLVFLVLALLASEAFAVTCTSVGNADWKSNTWTPAGCNAGSAGPAAGSDIIIVSGTNIKVDTNPPVVANITINAGGTLTGQSGSTLSLTGNLTNNGTFTANGGTVALVGTTPQTITGTFAFANLTLNNPAGVTISGNVSLTGTFTPGTTPITVAAGFTMTINGTVYTGPCSGAYGAGYCASSPTVTSINTANPNPTAGASPVSWTVAFGASVTGVTAANFALVQAGGVSGAAITAVSGSAKNWTVTASTGTGSGTLGLNMVNVSGISPALTTAMPFTGQVYTVDKTPPVVSSMVRANPNPTGLASVTWNVTFSKIVTAVAANDFALVQAGGVSGAAITSVAGSGANWTVTASTGAGNGTLGLNLIDDDTIIDGAGNPLGGAGLGNGNFTGEVYTVAMPVRYYHDTTAGVAIGVDGPTNVQSGTNVTIPPVITASLLTTNACTGNARSANHPVGSYTHSRWYLTADYAVATNIAANPGGSAFLRGQATTDAVVVSLYDYNPVSGAKALIGSSAAITLTNAGTTTAYPYTISSPIYTVPAGHRLMLQYDFNQAAATDRARVYCSAASSYIEVMESAASTLTCFNDNFNRANGAPAGNWVVANEGGTFGNPTIVGNRLRLTDASTGVSTMAALQQLFPAAGNKIVVEFDYFAYGGTSADGIGVVLSDASVAPVPGAFGGSLGYAPKQAAQGGDTTHPGFAGGWIGLALDEYGNFSANTEGRSGGAAPGITVDSAAVRGSGSGYTGYPYHRGTATLAPGVDIPGATAGPGHRYRITIDHSNGVNAWTSVERDTSGTGTAYATLIAAYDAKAEAGQAAVPTNWYLSFTGSTGAATNIHEVDNLQICTTQPQPMPTLHHIRVLHDGAGLTCAAETVTVKACADANCTSLYLGSVTVNLSSTGGVWSANPVTFTGGQTSVTLAKTTAGAVTLGGAATAPTTANATRCFSGATETCTLNYALSTACFDAVEVGAAAGTHIYTKLSATGFSLDILAANAGVINSNYKGTVAVDLVDPTAATGNCGDAAMGLSNAANYTFTAVNAGRRTFNFNYPVAAANVKVRIRDTSVTPNQPGCSTDNFAVRSVSLALTATGVGADAAGLSTVATPVIKAGANFTLTATASDTGYTGTPTIDSTALVAHAGAVRSGALTGAFSAAANGVASAAFSYDEVGYFQLNANGLMDATYTNVDNGVGDCTPDFSTTLVGGKYGCKIGSAAAGYFGRFIPDHFAITPGVVTTASNGYTYLGQDGFTTAFTLTAQNAANVTTQNYSGTFAKLGLTTWSNFGFSASGMPAGAVLSASATAPRETSLGSTWTAGSASMSAKHVISRPTNPSAVSNIDILAQPAEPAGADGVTMPTAVAVNLTPTPLYFGSIKIGNAVGSELTPLTLTTTALYCNAVSGASCNDWKKSPDNTSSFVVATPPTTSAVSFGNYQKNYTAATVAGSPKTVSLAGGVGAFTLSAPGAGKNGSVAMSIPLLTGANCLLATVPLGCYLPTTAAGIATFGVYQGRKEFIYLRENY